MEGPEAGIESKKEEVILPQRKFFTKALENDAAERGLDSREYAKTLERLIDTYIKMNVEHAALHTSRESGAAFPFSRMDSAEFAKRTFRELVMRLPSALEALDKNEEPRHHEVYGLGAPTNALGVVTPEFVARVKERGAIESFGELYAEFAAAQMPADPQEAANTEVNFSAGPWRRASPSKRPSTGSRKAE